MDDRAEDWGSVEAAFAEYFTKGDDLLTGRTWKVSGFTVGRGYGARIGAEGERVMDLIGLSLRLEDLDQPANFVLEPDHADLVGQALLDSVAKYREEL